MPLTEEADVLPEVVSGDEDVEVELEVEAEVEAVDKEKETGERKAAKQLPKALPPLSQTQVSMLKARAAGYAQVGPLMRPPQQQQKPKPPCMATATKTLQKAQPREMTTEKAQINFVSRNLSKGWGLGKI